MDNDEHRKVNAALAPYVTALLQKLNKDYPKLRFSGFIWGPTGDSTVADYFLKVGNVMNEGQDFVEMHYRLALSSAYLDAKGQGERVEVVAQNQATTPPSSQDIADKLALALMATPLYELPPSVQAYLDQYLASRTPEGDTTNG